ncbi:MAG: hypothetical protein ACYS5V_07395 [Planctomycetota bacterium]
MEKVILLATAVILVPALLYLMVINTPLSVILLDGQPVNPDDLDTVLLERAEEVKNEIDGAGPVSKPVRNWVRDVKVRYDKPCPSTTLTPLVCGPPKLLDVAPPKEFRVELATLAKALVAPAKPLASVQPEVLMKPKQADPEAPARAPGALAAADFKYVEVIGAHVAAVFEHGKVLEAWRKALAKARVPATLTVMAVEAQRQQRLPDGTWGKPEPVSIVRVPAEAPYGPIPAYDGKNGAEVRNALTRLADQGVMEWIVEPDYYSLFKDGQQVHWIENKPRTRVSDLEGVPDAPRAPGVPFRPRPGAERFPREAVPPLDSYGRPIRPGVSRPPPPGRTRRPRPELIDPMLDYGQPPPGRPGRVRSPRRPAPSPRRRYPGGRDGFDRGPVPPGGRRPRPTPLPSRTPIVGPPGPVVEEKPKLNPRVPPLATQTSDPAGIFEVWFHDTSLVQDMQYRYRFRLVLVSPLFGRANRVKDEADAAVVSMNTPWSPWSDPAGVQQSLDFFLVGFFPPHQVTVEVFVQKWGQSLGERFNVRRGQRIRKKVTRSLLHFDGESKDVEIDFDTGAWATDFVFDVPVPGKISKDTQRIYLDAKGRLCRRSLTEDEASERYEQLQQRAAEKLQPAGRLEGP